MVTSVEVKTVVVQLPPLYVTKVQDVTPQSASALTSKMLASVITSVMVVVLYANFLTAKVA
jgi:hypothetical protein